MNVVCAHFYFAANTCDNFRIETLANGNIDYIILIS